MIRKTPAGVIQMNEITERERETLRELERVLLTEVPPERFCCDGKDQDKRMCILPGDHAVIVTAAGRLQSMDAILGEESR